jgi:signal transduction histidine kinase
MSRRLGLVVWPAGIALGVAAEWVGFGWDDPRHWILDLVVGWTFMGCGVVAARRRPEDRVGLLMMATGATWFLGNFARSGVAAVAWVGAYGLFVYRGPLVQLVLSYPTGRTSSWLQRSAVAVGYLAAFVYPVWQNEIATIALSVFFVGVAGREYVRSVGRSRRARLLALRATAGLGLLLAGVAAIRLGLPRGGANDQLLLAYQAGLCVLAVGLLVGLLSASWERADVTDLVVQLGEARSGTLRGELSRALGDPTLDVAYWLSDSRSFVDGEGRTVTLPESDPARSVTLIEQEGETVAALVHDPSVLGDPGLLEAVSAAAQLAASNARLQAEVRARLTELQASRRRILEAGDAERLRLEGRLHEGAERRLSSLGFDLRRARDLATGDTTKERIERADSQLEETLQELAELGRGLHPRILTEAGLRGALVSVAERATVPVEVAVLVDELPLQVEAAVYFVCSEALANVTKYAAASRASVVVTVNGGVVTVDVEDDGAGGADLANGTGLRGLADRIEALGGALRLFSPPGKGTRLTAEIPITGENNRAERPTDVPEVIPG